VISGNTVTVAYSKPSSNPIQTTSGGQAQTISAQTVTNNVAASASIVYVSSSIANASPSMIEMTYNTALANITPYGTAYTVLVNSSAVAVNAIAISGTKVQLYLASPVANGNAVTVAYTKPATSGIQSTSGAQAQTLTAQAVTNSVGASANPVYVGSSVENAYPSRIDITYNMALANVTPYGTAYTVLVNSVARSVTAVAISGSKVQLYLASPIASGNVITVAYTKPSSSPIQATSGGQAPTFTAKAVTNNMGSTLPAYLSSSVENANPSRLELTYDMPLANVTPYGTAYTVLVNSVARGITAVSISGSKVHLYLASPIASGNVITVAYTKPSSGQIQGTNGGQAPSITAKPVTNNVGSTVPVYVSSSIESVYPSRLILTYNMSLANVTPYGSAYSVLVNSVAKEVVAVAISGSQVHLYLSSAVTSGNVVTVSYTKPASYGIQSAAGGFAASMTSKPVTNNCTSSAGKSLDTDNLSDSLSLQPGESVIGMFPRYDASSEYMTLYPNPNNGKFTIDFANPILGEKCEIIISDLYGKLVYQGTVLREELSKHIDLPGIRKGIYVLIIKDKEIIITKKFMKN
jgi:uncharacterized repeat protein (TIGR02059 family)